MRRAEDDGMAKHLRQIFSYRIWKHNRLASKIEQPSVQAVDSMPII
jgi:hypothetical protein